MDKRLKSSVALFILLVALVSVSGCGAHREEQEEVNTPLATAVQEAASQPEPSLSPEILAQAEQYAALADVQILAEKSDPWAEMAYEGKPQHTFLVKPGGKITDLILQPYQDGQTLEQAAKSGAAQAALESVRVLWEGKAYSCLHATLENATIPGLATDGDGILWLEISGDCAIDTGGSKYSCISGFSSIYITGSGSLTLSGGEGSINSSGGALPVPALVIDGPQLTGGFFQLTANGADSKTVPTVLLVDGGLNAQTLLLPPNGGLCVIDGGLQLDMLGDGGDTAMVFRGGKAEIKEINFFHGGAHLTVAGGEVLIEADTISTESVVVAGGKLTAPDINEKTGLVLLDGEAISYNPRPYDLGSPAEWMDGGEPVGMQAREQETAICDTAQVGWMMTVQGTFAPIHAWGGLALELADTAAIQSKANDSALGATAMYLSGTGRLTLSGPGTGIGIWAWGEMPAPYFELCEGTELVIECDGESLTMGGESGQRGLARLSGGSLSASNNLWLQNSDMELAGCTVKTATTLAVEQGNLTVSAGSLQADGLYLGDGSLTVTGGVLELGADGLEVNGDIHISGGTIRLPGGQEALHARGILEITGGTVEDSDPPK